MLLAKGLHAIQTVDALRDAIGQSLEALTPRQCANYFKPAGYALCRRIPGIGAFGMGDWQRLPPRHLHYAFPSAGGTLLTFGQCRLALRTGIRLWRPASP